MLIHRKKLKKRTKVTAEQKAYKYQCSKGHIRIEKEALGRSLPNCPACEKDGQANRFRYIGRYTIAKDQLKKSKFHK